MRVLVVEDWFLVAEEVVRMVEGMGHEVVGPAPDLERAVEMARRAALDAAVLDVNLEGKLVFPAADVLTERGVPFVFASGYDESVVPPRFARVPRVRKPFTGDQLEEAICRACRVNGQAI